MSRTAYLKHKTPDTNNLLNYGISHDSYMTTAVKAGNTVYALRTTAIKSNQTL